MFVDVFIVPPGCNPNIKNNQVIKLIYRCQLNQFNKVNYRAGQTDKQLSLVLKFHISTNH